MADFLRKNKMLERLRLLEKIPTILDRYVYVSILYDR